MMDSSVSDRNDSKTIPFKELQTPIKLAHFFTVQLEKTTAGLVFLQM